MNPTWAIVAAALLAVAGSGCLASDDARDAASQVPRLADGRIAAPNVAAAAVLADLRAFCGTYEERAGNTDDHLGARAWLADAFADAGLDVWRHNFTNGIDQENIVGIKWGASHPNQWVIIGGHYDMTVSGSTGAAQPTLRARSQGCYDDGSGTVMTVHLASAWASVPTPYTLAFVAFDGEERGLQGSQAFSEALQTGNHSYGHVEVRGMLDLDMIGLNWPGVDAPIYFDTNSPNLEATVRSAAADMGMPADMVKYQGISLGRSDYHWFMEMGVPTGFFISDFEEWQLPGDIPLTTPASPQAYPFWHIEDTWETMVLMAGSEEDVERGFQTALDLATASLATLADEGVLAVEGGEGEGNKEVGR